MQTTFVGILKHARLALSLQVANFINWALWKWINSIMYTPAPFFNVTRVGLYLDNVVVFSHLNT